MFGHDKRSLGQLFDTPVDGTSYSYFQVPQYQRKYDWEKEKQVAKLVDDSFENKGNSYFMGTLITCRAHDHNNSVELIDGQQRLATLAIFLRALADYIYARKNEPEFPEALREKMGEMQYELQSKIIKKGSGKSDEIVIHLPQKINKFFRYIENIFRVSYDFY